MPSVRLAVLLAAWILAATLAVPMAGSANLIANGGFEQGPAPPAGGVTTMNGGTSAIAHWTVTGSGVRYCDSAYWEPADGARSLALNTSGPRGVQQSFPTTIGVHYEVHFFMAGDSL